MTKLEELVGRAESMVPRLLERAPATERLGRVSDETIAEFTDAGFFRAFVPRRYGGYEFDYPLTQVELCNQIGRGCASSAWVLTVVSCHPWLLGMLPDSIQRKVWGTTGPDTLMTTAVSPADGKIKRVAGGFELKGRWQFSSGVDAAQWIMFGGPLDGERARAPWLTVPKSHWQIDHQSWNPAGLRGTGSKDVYVDAFVAEEDAPPFGERPGAHLSDSYIYKLPFVPLFYYNVACPALGVARGAVEEYRHQILERPHRGDSAGRQMRFAESAAEVDAAYALLKSDALEIRDLASSGTEITEAASMRWERNIGFATRLCVNAVSRLQSSLGAHGIDYDNPVHRAGRDIQAIGTHAGNWDVRAGNYARWAFGIEGPREFYVYGGVDMTAEPTMPEIMGRMGRLTAYAVFMRPTAKYDTESDEGRELMRRHLLFQLEMQDNDTLLAAGPLDGAGSASTLTNYRAGSPQNNDRLIDASGMYFIVAPSREAAETIAASEPFEAAGWRTHTLCHCSGRCWAK